VDGKDSLASALGKYYKGWIKHHIYMPNNPINRDFEIPHDRPKKTSGSMEDFRLNTVLNKALHHHHILFSQKIEIQ
jgi:hypothetical protein